ncbi:alcohol dehydrogenase [Ceratobasidium sp. AG-Ba]|nr:alcohol dehydrogenase [Ceratobasidium sp. AG-Ba]
MSQHAFMLLAKGGKTEVGSRSIPTPQATQALVKVTTAAIDYKITGGMPFIIQFPAVLGMDAAGIVESVGPNVTRFKKGDRRAVFHGQFQPSDLFPITLSIVKHRPSQLVRLLRFLASSRSRVSPSLRTVLYLLGNRSSFLQVAHPLVNTFARIASFSTIATTANAKHTDLLKSLGATHTYDHNVAFESIQSALSLPFNRIFDAAPTSDSEPLGVTLLIIPSATSGHYGTVRPLADDLKDKLEGKTTYHSVFGSS